MSTGIAVFPGAKSLLPWLFAIVWHTWSGLATAAQTDIDAVCPFQVVDDRTIHVHNAQDVEDLRLRLFQYIWNQDQLPDGYAGLTVSENTANPFGCGGANLSRIDRLNVAMGPALNGTTIEGWAWHFVPVNRNNRLVIVHDGHMDCSDFTGAETGPAALGMQMTVNALVAEGYDVLFALMPLYVPDQCLGDHSLLFQPDYAPPEGSPIRYFVDTTLQSLNFLVANNTYAEIDMTGLSGGGWTTTLYAALDDRVVGSFPVAGSIPLYLRGEPAFSTTLQAAYMGVSAASGTECSNLGDAEQYDSGLYDIAGYPDLYVLGAYGSGRRQVQILNRQDNCCFGESESADPATYDNDLRVYENDVRRTLQSLGRPSFRVEVDEASVAHQVSRHALYNVILGDLGGARANTGAATGNLAFMRGVNGRLWQNSATGWRDLGPHVVGTPSVIENALYPIQMAVRNAVNAPELVYFDGNLWNTMLLPTSDIGGTVVLPGGRIINDPVMTSLAGGQFDVVAQGTDFRFYHWRLATGDPFFEVSGGSAYSVGLPALAPTDPNSLSVFYRDGQEVDAITGCIEQPYALYQATQGADGTWQPGQRVPASTHTFPSAANNAQHVFLLGENAAVWEYATGESQQITGGTGLFAGSPGAPVVLGGDIGFHVRTSDNDLGQIKFHGTWRYTSLGLGFGTAQSIVDSPVDTVDGVYWTGLDGQIRFLGAAGVTVLDKVDSVFRDDLEGAVGP